MLCSSCLSADRRLVPLNSLNDVHISMRWLNINFDPGDHVCWECKAKLKKIYSFREQALRAQALLRTYAAVEKPFPLKNLSNLSISIKDTYDETICYSNVIKEEIFTVEPEALKTDVNEISMGEADCFKTDVDEEFPSHKIGPFKDAPGYVNDASTVEMKLLKTEVDVDISEGDIGSFKTEVGLEGDHYTSKNKEQSIQAPVQNKKPTASAISKSRKKKSEIKDPTLRYNPTNLLSKHSISKVEERFLVRKLSIEEVNNARELDKTSNRYMKCPYKCDKCITSYFTEHKYNYHVEKHHLISVGGLVCPVCEVRFKRQDSLDYHHDCHFRSYQCRQCDYEHHKLTTMLTHMDREHDEIKKFNCKHCNAVLPSLRKLRYHREKYHKGTAKCNVCRNIFSTTSALRQHMKVHEDIPFLECTVCHKKCRGKDSLQSHMEKVHSGKAELFYCKPCDRFFNSKTVYLTHIRTTKNHVTTKLECDYCGKKFIGKTPLIYHIKKSHMCDEKFECNLCRKKFVANCKLNSHIKNVHGDKSKREKRHMCSECGKAFKVITVYKHHMRIHTGEKPFQCQYCPWKFRQQSTLTTHQKLKHKDIVALQNNTKKKMA